MTSSLERPPSADNHNDWRSYIHEMAQHKERNEPDELEQQLLEPHPTLPGEREAYLWLEELHQNDDDLSLKLDDRGLHVIPR